MAETATASPARTADEIKRDPLVAAAVARVGDAIIDVKEFAGEITLSVAPDRIREVMAKGAEHAKTAHKMTTIPPDMAAKVKGAIKDKK